MTVVRASRVGEGQRAEWRLRLLYVRGPVAERELARELAIVQQLRRITRDVLIAPSASASSVAAQVAKARAVGGLHALVTSPALGEDETIDLIGALRSAGEPLAIFPVVGSEHRGARLVAAGADGSLVLVGGVVTNHGEIVLRVKRRLRATARTEWLRSLIPRVLAVPRRVLAQLVTLRDRVGGPEATGPIEVHVARRVDEDLVAAASRLVPKLRMSAPGHWELEQIVRHPGTTLLVARDGGLAIGMLMLVVVRGPAGVRAWIDDLIVDPAATGRGVGALLTQEAVRLASQCGAQSVQLSCPPSKPGPNRAYQRLGFERRETNLYRYRMSS